MIKFKVGAWVMHSYGKGKIKNVYTNSDGATELEFTNGGRLEGYLCDPWKPRDKEWCWFSIEYDPGDFEHPTLMKYGEQPKGIPWIIEPFIGNLPTWM